MSGGEEKRSVMSEEELQVRKWINSAFGVIGVERTEEILEDAKSGLIRMVIGEFFDENFPPKDESVVGDTTTPVIVDDLKDYIRKKIGCDIDSDMIVDILSDMDDMGDEEKRTKDREG